MRWITLNMWKGINGAWHDDALSLANESAFVCRRMEVCALGYDDDEQQKEVFWKENCVCMAVLAE